MIKIADHVQQIIRSSPFLMEALAEELPYPCLLKGVHGARGNHVYLVNDAEQLHRRLWHYPYGELLLQEYLPAAEDYRVMVVGYRALPVMVSPPKGDFRTNYALGGHFERQDLAAYPAFQDLAEKAARALRREITAIDLRLKGDQPMVLEINRQPDFEGFERATKYDVASEVVGYLRERVGRMERVLSG